MLEPLNKESLGEFEALFNKELPHSFKTFLEIIHQGLGRCHINCPPPNEGAILSVRFFGFKSNRNIIEITKELRLLSKIPDHFLPFAHDIEFFYSLTCLIQMAESSLLTACRKCQTNVLSS